MPAFQTRPERVEAVQIRRGEHPGELADAVTAGRVLYVGDGRVIVATATGAAVAFPGDWIVIRPGHNLSVYTAEEFKRRYTRVEEQ